MGFVNLLLHALRRLFGAQPTSHFSSDWNGDRQQSSRASAGRKSIVRFTPKAIAELHKAQPQDGERYLRVGVSGGGPTGYIYDLKFDVEMNANDYTDNVDGITVVVNRLQAIYLEGVTIDWQIWSNGQQGFWFDNPNAD
jgi:iron-sulfur cluster assembly protein